MNRTGFSSIPSAAALTSLANSILTNASLNNKINTNQSTSENNSPINPTAANMSTTLINSDATDQTSSNTPQTICKVSLDFQLIKPDKLYPTPSMRDSLPFEVEFDLRLVGCELIQTAGRLLKLPQTAMATAQVLFHRYFYLKSFVRNPMEYYAMASIFLSSKIEECPRRIRDVMNVFHHIKTVRTGKVIKPMPIDDTYQETKSQINRAERRILKELGFCVHVKHPHKIIFIYLQAMECSQLNLSQKAWNYMNDSFRTDVFLRYSPENIVCACIYLSANESQISLPQNPPWFTIFGANEETIKEICVRILHLYSHQTKSQEELEKLVNDCRDYLNEEKRKNKEPATTIEITNEIAKEDTLKSVNEINKQNEISSTTVQLINSSKVQLKTHSTASPNPIDLVNVLNQSNPYYLNHHHHPNNYHIPGHEYPLPHSSHHSMVRNSSFNSFNYYPDGSGAHYMNGNEHYYNNYHNENFYEVGNIKRAKSSSQLKSSAYYKESEEYYSKKRYSSNQVEEKSSKERSTKISNQTNKYSRSRSRSPWKKNKDEKSKTNRRKRSKSRSLSSVECETNDNSAKSPISNSKHKKKKSHHTHRKEENKDSSNRNRRDKSRSRSRTRQKSSSKSKHRSRDGEESRYAILS